jgi:succinate dehydrogenase/fumarate reductase flavoprotein subunit
MIIDLLTDNGRITGATAVNVRTGEFTVIKAKAVILATGSFARCYKPETPLIWKYQLRYHMCPASVSGDGWAMAYRAGAELSNMDITGWAFRIRDDPTISFGNFTWNDGITAKYLTCEGEELGYTTAPKYEEMERKGLTPLYNTLEHLPDDYHKRMEVAYADERLVSFKIAEDRGFNPRTHRYEMMPNMPHCFQGPQGVAVDEDSMTAVKGLFAIGACASGYLGGVLFSGLTIGDNIHNFVNEAEEPAVDEAQAESQKQTGLAPLSVKEGTEPMELECATRYVCERYVGQFKSEGKLREGLRRLGSLRREFLPKLTAKNPHHLMRCLEVRNVMDLAEVHINGVMERKETRGNHIRSDYPERDKSLDHMITYQRLENGKSVLERRKAPELSPEYYEEEK